MARKARIISSINSYTILLRATNEITFNKHDKAVFLEILSKYSSVLNYNIFAYNLTSKVFAFVLYDCDTPIDTTMRKIVVSFAYKYNLIHARRGKVFYGRFVSLPANSIKDVWDMVYNVHNLYESDFNSATNYFKNPYLSLNCVKLFFENEQKFVSAVLERKNSEPLKNKIVKTKINDSELINLINNEFMPVSEIKKLPQNKLTAILKEIISKTQASARQIARITSLPLRLLWKINKEKATTKE